MRRYDESKKLEILSFIDHFFSRNNTVPSVRDISSGTGIAVTTVHRYLNRMRDAGELEYNGRKSINTRRISLENEHNSIAVLGFVSCGPGEEEQETIIEYIRMPTSLTGKGDFFALVAKGESMIDAGVRPGDYVIVRKQHTANNGEIIVALQDGKNNLKKLMMKGERFVLSSCNSDKSLFPDIPASDLQIQGVAVGFFHKLNCSSI